MKAMNAAVMSIFLIIVVGLVGCESTEKVVNGDHEDVPDGDESVIDGDLLEEEVVEVEIVDIDTVDIVEVDLESEAETEAEIETELIDGDVDDDVADSENLAMEAEPESEPEQEFGDEEIVVDGDIHDVDTVEIEVDPELEIEEEIADIDLDPEPEPEHEPACTIDSDCPAELPFCVNGECVECLSETDCPDDDNLWTYPVCQDSFCNKGWTCDGIRFIPPDDAFNCYGLDHSGDRLKFWLPNELTFNEWMLAPDGVCHVYCATPRGDVPPERCAGMYPEPFEGRYSCHYSDALPEGCSARSEDCTLLPDPVDGDVDPDPEPEPDLTCTTGSDCPAALPFCVNGECVECLSETDCPDDDNLWTYPVCQDSFCNKGWTCDGIRFIPPDDAFNCYGLDHSGDRLKFWLPNELTFNEWMLAPDGVCHVYCATPRGDVPPERCAGMYPEPFEGRYSCHYSDALPEGCSARSEDCTLLE